MFPYFWKHPLPCFPVSPGTNLPKMTPLPVWGFYFFFVKKPPIPPKKPTQKSHWSSMAAQRWAKDFCWTWRAFKVIFFWYNPRPRSATVFASLKKQAIPERKGFVFEASIFLRVSCFNFGGVNLGLMWRASTKWVSDEVPETSLIRVCEPIIRVYNGLYTLDLLVRCLEK